MSLGDAPDGKAAGSDFEKLTEGSATVLYEKGNTVFYNKVQEFNRDLSTVVIEQFALRKQAEVKEKNRKRAERLAAAAAAAAADPEAKDKLGRLPRLAPKEFDGVRILEALSATGLRSIRYWNEIRSGLVKEIVVNDLEETAVAAIERNVRYNNAPLDRVRPNCGDACDVMYSERCLRDRRDKGFDVIDLDPYGSAIEFLDGAVQSVRDGGLLCVTCTDKAVLCGAKATETCFAKYGSMPWRGAYCHEMAVRIVLNAINSAANRYARCITPLVSMSIDFYVRVFVRVRTSKAGVKHTARKTAMVYQSNGCDAFYVQPMGTVDDPEARNPKFKQGLGPPCPERCPFTGTKHKVLGPIWSGPLHDPAFIAECTKAVEASPGKYGTEKKILGQLAVCRSELECPLYYKLGSLAHTFHTAVRIRPFRSAIINAGFRVSQSHADPGGIKTDAPPSLIMDIMKQIVKDNPTIGAQKRETDTKAKKLAELPMENKIDFSNAEGSEGVGVSAFFPNPEEFWGPKSRATSGRKTAKSSRKRVEPPSTGGAAPANPNKKRPKATGAPKKNAGGAASSDA